MSASSETEKEQVVKATVKTNEIVVTTWPTQLRHYLSQVTIVARSSFSASIPSASISMDDR